MQFEAAQAKSANNEFMRHHHLRSCIYHAVAVVEAFLNQKMRRYMEESGHAEEEIHKKLRRTKIEQKLKAWPSDICKRPVTLAPQIVDIFDTYKNLRDETTHPKRRDHALYVALNASQPDALMDAVCRALVTIYEAKRQPFPYWVLGWNYVGLNGNAAHPVMSNNMNGFFWTLKGMGANISASEFDWDKRHMVKLTDYEALKAALDSYPHDIEPFWKEFPFRPRLTRRWWDHEFIYANIEAAQSQQ
jgi:hypothetical protein